MEWMFLPLKRYVQFSGRSPRKEFWLWTLFLVIVSLLLSIIDQALHLTATTATTAPAFAQSGRTAGGGVLTSLFSLATFLPNLAVQVRRLHDTNRSGWWLLLPLVPIIIGVGLLISGLANTFLAEKSGQAIAASPPQGMVGLMAAGGIFFVIGGLCAILIFVWFCLDGTRGPNRFGEDPKRQDLGEVFS